MKIRKSIEINEDSNTETPLNSYIRYEDILLQKVIGNCNTCYFQSNSIFCITHIDKPCYRCTDLESDTDYCFIKYEDKE